MLPKSYLAFKWAVYGLVTLLLFAVQSLVLNHIRVLHLTPFLYPMLPAVAAMYEGSRRGPVFALALGVVCDLLLPAPFKGFYTVVFPTIALFSAMVAENFFAPGVLCGIFVSTGGLLLSGAFRILAQLLSGGGHLALMAQTSLGETLLTLPALLVVLPAYRMGHRRCAVDY